METRLPRSEIVRLVRSLLGIQTTSGLAAQTQDQHVTAVRMAAADVAKDCRWVSAQKRVTVTLGAQQAVLDYPEASGPGAVLAVAVYDIERYIPLEQRIIPIQADTDQELALGGTPLVSVTARPRYFEQRKQIEFWPRTDKAYQVRVEFMQRMDLPLENSESVVDAMLIVYLAASLISKQMENDSGALYYQSRYEDRLGDLRGWQSAGTAFALDEQADLGEDEGNPLERMRPNWNTAPTPPLPLP